MLHHCVTDLMLIPLGFELRYRLRGHLRSSNEEVTLEMCLHVYSVEKLREGVHTFRRQERTPPSSTHARRNLLWPTVAIHTHNTGDKSPFFVYLQQ